MFKIFVKYSKGYRLYAILASLTIMLEVLLEVYIPYIMKDVVNIGISTGDMGIVIQKGVLMVLVALLSLFFGIISARFAVLASTGFAKNVRKALFDKVQSFSFKNVDNFSTASLITRLTTDVTNMQQSFQMCIRMLIRSPVMLVASTVMANKVSGEMGQIFAIAIPVLAISMGAISVSVYPRFRVMLKRFDNMNAQIQENLTAIRVVKAFVRHEYEIEQFNEAAEDVTKAQVKAEKLLVLNNPVSQLVMYSCMIATCWIGGNAIIGGSMLAGDLMSFISYISQILSSVMMLTMIFVNLILSRASAKRVGEVLSEVIDISDADADPSLLVGDGSIEFEDVSFSYSGQGDNLTLKNVNLRIAPGETIGIIGGTGSAKTTLVQLIPRLYDVYDGTVKVGGKDVRSYTLQNLRSAVSVVLQKNVLFSGSIAENLRWGDMEATEAEIKEAAQAAQAHEFIESFPDGYQTELGQGGVNVSGGQKQRLCIARALLKKPKIIILDDSTSAVDTATDAKIRSAFREKLADTTTIIIAQRIASVMDADRIIVMNDGEIDGIGTHEELMQTNKIYKEVYSSQQKGVA